MLELIIRYATFLLCSDYINQKLTTTNYSSLKRKIFLLASSIPLAALFLYFLDSVHFISYFVLYFFHTLYYVITVSAGNSLSLLFSYGICYCIYTMSAFFSTISLGTFNWFLREELLIPATLIQLSITLFMYIFSNLLFRIPRLKKGMPFLNNTYFSTPGSFVCIFVLLCVMLISSQFFSGDYAKQWYLILILFILVLFLFLFIWWKNQIRQSYLKQLKERELKRLEGQLTDCENTLQTLKLENETLSKLIHRDNKQLASLQLAVETFLSSLVENKCIQEEIGNTLLQEIRTEMDNRKQLVSNLSTPYVLPSTKVPSVDHLLLYILHRGQAEGIHLDLSLTGNVHYLLEHTIKEHDFLTLLADILENALIATKYANGTAILLHIGIIDETYSIDVWDSGIPFTKETLLHLGRKRYTTHKKTGGSGIGLMSTFELLEKYQASLYIDEKLAKENMYTKRISIVFDGKREYHLHTNRSAQEQSFLRQRTDLQLDAS